MVYRTFFCISTSGCIADCPTVTSSRSSTNALMPQPDGESINVHVLLIVQCRFTCSCIYNGFFVHWCQDAMNRHMEDLPFLLRIDELKYCVQVLKSKWIPTGFLWDVLQCVLDMKWKFCNGTCSSIASNGVKSSFMNV